ncbi:MAG TPA: sulfur oxidation c-type cytochrome SoxA [Usitatibacter sp.]|nr:sulfur oxidation c-type cytochrome SoxA [Usitatibacter sp.]
MNPIHRAVTLLCVSSALVAVAAHAQTTEQEIQKYREAVGEDNPAELWEMRGEALWKEARGPKHASLERCDIGLGPGVVKGAYAVLPKYFADSGKVQDLESRLVSCMGTLQGISPEEAKKDHFGNGEKKSVMEALVAWIASQSRGMPMHVSLSRAEEKEAYEIGKKMFYYRAGPHDFSCATCHSHEGLRIRLQDLPNLTSANDARRAYTTWPGYRVSQGELRTMQHRIFDCYRQQRFPEPGYASDAVTALTMYLAVNANGGIYNAPSVKR